MAINKIIVGMEADGSKVREELGGIKKAGASLKKTLIGAAAGFFAAKTVKSFVAAAAKEEMAVHQLNTSLALAGTYSKEASASIQEFANRMQATTTLGNEAVLSQVALARNFTKTNEEAVKLTEAAIELSAQTGISLDSAVKNLGKSLGGLSGELGETVTGVRDLTAEQLKAGGAIDLVLDKFKGAAGAQVNTFSGAMLRLGNAWGDFTESIGEFITNSPSLIELIKGASQIFGQWSDEIRKAFAGVDLFRPFVKALMVVGEGIVRYLFKPIWGAAQAIASVINTAIYNFGKLMQFLDYMNEKMARFSSIFGDPEKYKESKEAWAAFAEEAKKGITDISQLGESDFSTNLINQFDAISEAVDKTNGKLSAVKNKVKENAEVIVASAEITKEALVGGIATGLQAMGAAMAQGQNAGDAFGKAMLGIFGDLMIQVGTQVMLTSGVLQTLSLALSNPFTAPMAFAAGAALVAAGGFIKAAVQKGSPQTPTTAAPVSTSVSETTGPSEVMGQGDTGPKVHLVVQGNVLSTKDTARHLGELLQEYVDEQGGKVYT